MSDNIKIRLHSHCLELLNTRIDAISKSVKELQEAANEENKSSMGDKYETGRALMHNEKDKYMSQLASFDKMRNTLLNINPDSASEHIKLGSLVISNQGRFFISIALGQVIIDKQDYYVISPASPIGQKLFGGKPGDSFLFNGKTYKVEEVQ